MVKSDNSLRKLVVSSIKRHTIKPFDFLYMTLFENQLLSEIKSEIITKFNNLENELPIAMTFIDNNNWTLLTTRRIISNIDGNIQIASHDSVLEWKWNDFKGYKDKPITYGQLKLIDEIVINFHIETGRASMIMIYGIRSLTIK